MKNTIREEELLAFIEYLYEHQEADEDEMKMYEAFVWGEINKLNECGNTYKKLKRKMKKLYNEGV